MNVKYLNKLHNVAYYAISKASYEVRKIYKNFKKTNKLSIEIKNDFSPLSVADKISHDIIYAHLHKFYPVISEEGEHHTKSATYFLIDPLDGTKEFINKNDEFCINIALVHNKKIILGLISAPYKNVIFSAIKNHGVRKNNKKFMQKTLSEILKKNLSSANHPAKYFFKNQKNPIKSLKCQVKNIKSKNLKKRNLKLRLQERYLKNYKFSMLHNINTKYMLVSRFHNSVALDNLYEKYKFTQSLQKLIVGSSFKFIKLLENPHFIYIRLSHTKHWDIAPAMILLKELNGGIIKSSFLQDKIKIDLEFDNENIINDFFIAFSHKSVLSWL